MNALAKFLQRKMIVPLIVFLGIVISVCVGLCITLFLKQEVDNRNLVLERAAESLKNPIALGSYVEIKSRLLSHNKKFIEYCLEYFSPNFQTNLCPSAKNTQEFDLNKKISIDLNPDQSVVLYFSWMPFIIKVSVFSLLIVIVLLSIGLILLKKARLIAEQLNDEVLMIYNGTEKKKFKIIEFKNISDQFLSYIEGQSKMLENDARAEMAKQVAHDIRSPLAALHVMTESLSAFPENERVLIRHAIQRINDIANELLQRGHQDNIILTNEESGAQVRIELIPALIDIIVSEKRMQYRKFAGLTIEADLNNSFGIFAAVNARELKRVISNLVNNSVESFINHVGQVTIRVRKNNFQVVISVIDNGTGIPSHIIVKLGQAGFSHGKASSNTSGSGLGLYHAKQTVEEQLGGKIEIESIEGSGTTININLALAEIPSWFSSCIDLTDKTSVVSLDDDLSIHQIWKKRLSNDIVQRKIQSDIAFENFVKDNLAEIRNTQFLIDFELLNQSKTGLDLIEEFGIAKNSILVTSRYDDVNIQRRAKALNLKILPKSLAGFVPIHVKNKKLSYDLILLDNDELIRMTWEMKAKKNGKKILCFSNASELRSRLPEFDFEILFFIDVNLSETENGEQFSKELFNLGFNNLYLATGYDADKFSHLTWIKGVVGKSPSF